MIGGRAGMVTAHLHAGGGIVWDSDPAAEVAESLTKAHPLLVAIGALYAVLFAVAVLFAAERFERARFWRAARGTLPDLVNALGSVARAVREAPSRATQDEGGPAMGPSFACAIRCADAELRGQR